ncbi:hypothetical protein MNBD_ALPHA01-1641 [hydrothermal vent metagenome]|uniref:Glutamine amidotransferase type-2 domain-containing protein n=1 Tax=hydrothermal vent metagenome TaxID=652676 RepID=A0A3B0RTE9_9ZZZZ
MKLNFQELENYINQKSGGKEFFFGAWSQNNITLDCGQVPKNIQLEKGDNWFMCRNGSAICNGLIFTGNKKKNMPEAVLFRGYLSETGIHSYSPSENVVDYWNKGLMKRHNGIFAAVIIDAAGKKISFVTDIFGIGPLYYRMLDDVLLFSSSPGLLSHCDDSPDYMSWKQRLEIGYIPSNKSLTKDIETVPAASVMTLSPQGLKCEKWYDYSNFAKGEKDLDDEALEQCEKYLSISMNRCKSIQNGQTILPFSSGYDSRRIFIYLMKNHMPFKTCTVQYSDKRGKDVDAVWAAKIAKDYNIEHVTFSIPNENDWYKNNLQRLFSVDAHTNNHSWSVSVFNHYNGQNITFYDGLGGDTLGNSIGDWNNFEGIHNNPNDKFNVIKAGLFKNFYAKRIKQDIFPSLEETLSEMSVEYYKQPKGINQSEITFCLWQTRRSTSLWAQQQIRPGQIIICPFLDLDYIEVMFQFSPEQKAMIIGQGAVLRKYWPEIAAYPGSRDLPESSPDIAYQPEINGHFALYKMIKDYFQTAHGNHCLRMIIPLHNRIILYLSQYSPKLSKKISWWASQIIELSTWWQSRPFIYSLTKRNNKVEPSISGTKKTLSTL